ncbi:MAG TPA: EAL domain-containing protein [Steroidobacteraceae bacterium]|nr:EAL domain-containing protein [Steroidobacteraceae bacterium]
MGSFRNRLLALIIGLVILTQTVTLIAVLAQTASDVKARADEQLRSGGSVVEQLMRFRTTQLAGAVAVLASDFGLREAVARGDSATILSSARNHAGRIGADLVLIMDAAGRVLAANTPLAPGQDALLREQVEGAASAPNEARFVVLGTHCYQLFLAPLKAPEPIGWAAMGFAVDDALARRIRDLVGVHVTLFARSAGGALMVASSLPRAERARLISGQVLAGEDAQPRVSAIGGEAYLSVTRPLDAYGSAVVVLLQKPMSAVLAPYVEVRDALLVIGGIALALAAAVGLLLARSATRPLGELVRAARRIQAGTYDTAVQASGGEEFRSLAATLNAMQGDIAEREARITHAAYHDPLTELPNRAYAERYLDELLRDAAASPAALIVMDIRNVREINASLGHHVGDEAVREVARRLRQNTGADDLVARLVANQFLVVTRHCSADRALLFAGQLAGVLRGGFHLPSVSLELHVAAGVCCCPDHGTTARELLRRAQIALEDSEEARGRVALYRAGRDEEHRRRLALAADLRRAIEQGDLTLVYQPKVFVATRTVSSFEALVRWTHPELGAIAPAEFVPIAERTGSSRRLTSWVLGAAVRQIAAWRAEGLVLDVAVNLSAPDILDPTLGDEILGTLEANAVEPARLALEITESAAMRDAPLAARHMQVLRAAGIRFAIDDYGTGYSSLSQLSRLPVDELKIDRSFMMHAHERRDDATIVRSTVELAHSMGLKVVAEGVENAQGWNLLRRLGCDLAQGYFISRPVPAADVAGFVRRANQLLPASDSTVLQIRALTELAKK